MKFTVEAEPVELEAKGAELVKAVARRLGVDLLDLVHPDDLLQRAGGKDPPAGPTLRHDALRGMQERERKLVLDTYRAMVRDIGKILEG